MIRIMNERLPPYSFPLLGLKTAFSLLEECFRNQSCADIVPSVTLEFSTSTLFDNYRKNNDLLTTVNRNGANSNLGRVLTTLLNNSPPDCDELLTEYSGVGRVKVFLSRTRAEFAGLCQHPGDMLFLDALETNLLRVSCDFFWADFVCSFLDVNGILTDAARVRFTTALENLKALKRATIPSRILNPLFAFMRYTLLGALHLNKHAVGGCDNSDLIPCSVESSLKRKRIVERIADGYTQAKRRRFTFSRLNDALGGISLANIEEQIAILQSHVIVTCPTRRSVELCRRFSVEAQIFLTDSCGFDLNDFTMLCHANTLLID